MSVSTMAFHFFFFFNDYKLQTGNILVWGDLTPASVNRGILEAHPAEIIPVTSCLWSIKHFVPRAGPFQRVTSNYNSAQKIHHPWCHTGSDFGLNSIRPVQTAATSFLLFHFKLCFIKYQTISFPHDQTILNITVRHYYWISIISGWKHICCLPEQMRGLTPLWQLPVQ